VGLGVRGGGPTLGRWSRRTAIAVVAVAALWLLVVNLALNLPFLAGALSRRPERFRIGWTVAWSVLPGRVHVRGLAMESHVSRVGWSLGIDRAIARLDLRALLDRRLHVLELRGEGARGWVARDAGARPAPRRRPAGAAAPRPRWSYRFDDVRLAHVHQIRFAGLRIAGDGTLEGALRVAPGREVEVRRARLRMRSARLLRGGRVVVDMLDLDADAVVGPYAPRQHPGLAAWSFVTGTLLARGQARGLPFLERAGPAAPATIGRLVATLRIDHGTLGSGSRMELASSAAPGSPFLLTAEVAPPSAATGASLRLAADVHGLDLGESSGGPTKLRAATLAVAAEVAETRVAPLIAAARASRARREPLRLVAEVRGEGVEIDAPSSRVALHAVLDRIQARADLGALFDREVAVESLEVEGAAVRFDALPARPRAPSARGPWSVRVDDARLEGVREVSLGDLRLVGAGSGSGSVTLDRSGTLAMPGATVTMRDGRLESAGKPIADALALALTASVDPVVSGPQRRTQLLAATSGHAVLSGRVASLAFLDSYLQRTPWLRVEGGGSFTADVGMERGRLATGSLVSVRGSPAATIFSNRASGSGTVEVAVEPTKDGARTALRLTFDRFAVSDVRRAKAPPFLRGRGLRVVAVAPQAVDVAHPIVDFEATVDMPGAEVPDVAVYDRLLPRDAGLSLLGGRGRASLHLEAATATRAARGSVELVADDARLRFQNLELAGRLAVRAPLASRDLATSRFDLAGSRIDLDGMSTRDVESSDPPGPPGWWAHAEMTSGSLTWGEPLALRGKARVRMRDSGPLLTLFAQKSRLLRWFDDALRVEDVNADATIRLEGGTLVIDPLRATGGELELRSRMEFRKAHRRGDLYVRYKRLAAGIALDDGKRTIELRKSLEWFEGRKGAIR